MGIIEDFQAFWRAFPRKTGKLDAEKAYRKARKRATAEEILAGIERYLKVKPSYADYCHPSTFLNKGRWLDEEDSSPLSSTWQWVCPHVPPCGQTAFRCHQSVRLEDARAKRTGTA